MRSTKTRFLTLLMVSLFTFSASVNAKLTIHDFAPTDQKQIQPHMPEDQNVTGRGANQKLADTMRVITQNKLHVKFINPEIKDMPINWRANNEPLQVVLSRIARQRSIDIVINPTQETLYVAIDKGQCTPHREKNLQELSNKWKRLNINDMPVLPSTLKVQVDLAGYNFRLC